MTQSRSKCNGHSITVSGRDPNEDYHVKIGALMTSYGASLSTMSARYGSGTIAGRIPSVSTAASRYRGSWLRDDDTLDTAVERVQKKLTGYEIP